ncbi:MAG: 50S ribosomal protein L9 [Verrucomicrobiota bacterium]
MATVEVILKEKIEGLGAEADVVKVKRGFALNYLIPHAKAYEATKGNLRQIQNLQAIRAEREAKELEEATLISNRLKKHRIKVELAIGQGGKAFGSITTQDIHEAISAADKKFATIDRHKIQLDKPIKNTGDFEIPVKLHSDLDTVIRLNVSAKVDGEAAAERDEADED